MGLLNFLQCPPANEQEAEYDRSGVNHKRYSKVAGLFPAFPLPKTKEQLWEKSQSQNDWFRIQKPQAETQGCSGILLNFSISMWWLYHIISFFLKPPTHPPPTDDPDSYFIEKIEVIGNELYHLPTTKTFQLGALASKFSFLHNEGVVPPPPRRAICPLVLWIPLPFGLSKTLLLEGTHAFPQQ